MINQLSRIRLLSFRPFRTSEVSDRKPSITFSLASPDCNTKLPMLLITHHPMTESSTQRSVMLTRGSLGEFRLTLCSVDYQGSAG